MFIVVKVQISDDKQFRKKMGIEIFCAHGIKVFTNQNEMKKRTNLNKQNKIRMHRSCVRAIFFLDRSCSTARKSRDNAKYHYGNGRPNVL